MKVQVQLLSTLRCYNRTGADLLDLDVPEGAKVYHVLDILSIPPDIQKVILLNGRHTQNDQPLSDGDSLTLFPPVEGG